MLLRKHLWRALGKHLQRSRGGRRVEGKHQDEQSDAQDQGEHEYGVGYPQEPELLVEHLPEPVLFQNSAERESVSLQGVSGASTTAFSGDVARFGPRPVPKSGARMMGPTEKPVTQPVSSPTSAGERPRAQNRPKPLFSALTSAHELVSYLISVRSVVRVYPGPLMVGQQLKAFPDRSGGAFTPNQE